jgi:cation transport regulator ChaC
LVDREVVLDDGMRVRAVTARYAGPNQIGDMPLAQRAQMARLAVGTDGRCADYVTSIADMLAELSIDDPAVQEFAKAVRREKS